MMAAGAESDPMQGLLSGIAIASGTMMECSASLLTQPPCLTCRANVHSYADLKAEAVKLEQTFRQEQQQKLNAWQTDKPNLKQLISTLTETRAVLRSLFEDA